MEVQSPMDFNFNITSSPYPSAPSTPKPMGECYFSAPASPTRLTQLYNSFDDLLIAAAAANDHHTTSLATVPFAWEDKPGVPKSFTNFFQDDFAFDVSSEFSGEHPVSSAEDLFHGGVIKPLATPPEREGRRNRGSSGSSSGSGLASSRSRRTRSMSPLRGSNYQQPPAVAANVKPPAASTFSTLSSSKKWSFKDLFLFRSASDGRAMDRDPLKKYSAIFRKHDEDFRNSSLRSIEYPGYGSGSGSKRRGRVSAHELHYTVNRAVSNDMKKKTFLPYKQGILGRLAFNPTVHALANGFGFSHKNEH